MMKQCRASRNFGAGHSAVHLKYIVLVAIVVAFAGKSLAASPSESLGDALLDETTAAADDASIRTSETPAARALLDPLRRLAGLPVEDATPDDWLLPVTQRMRRAQAQLVSQDASGGASRLQGEAVTELDALLVMLQKQCDKCAGQCNSPPSNQAAKPKPGKAGAKPGASTAQAGAPTAQARRAALDGMVKDLWGRLPQRQRDELLQPLSEEFVPEYSAETEAYFRALAEPRTTEESQP